MLVDPLHPARPRIILKRMSFTSIDAESRRYRACWNSLRQSRRALAVALALMVIGGVAGKWLIPEIAIPIVLAGFVTWFVAWMRHASFLCPRCGNSYFVRTHTRSNMHPRCATCDLAQWAEYDPEPSAPYRDSD